MQEFEQARAGQGGQPRRLCLADPERTVAERTVPERMAHEPDRAGRTERPDGLRRFASWVAGWRARQRARRRMESWLAIDPRVLADIGVARAEVQAAVYAEVPFAKLRDRPAADLVATALVRPCRMPPRLRLVTPEDLDAAA